jgi:hypothetical protein
VSARVARMAPFVAVTFGWVPVVLMAAPVWLDAGAYEGYRPEEPELITAVTVGAAIAGVIVGFVLARRVVLVVTTVAVAAVVCLLANDALYRSVIPLPDDLRSGGWGIVNVLWAPVGAAVGSGLGQLRPSVRRRRSAWPGRGKRTRRVVPGHPLGHGGGPPEPGVGPVSRRRLLAVAAVVGLVGAFLVPEFLRGGAELAITRFSPGVGVTVAGGERATVPLDAGRHAMFGYYGSRPCSLGDGISLSRPAVPLTDNGDSIVTVLLGTFELDAARSVEVACDGQPGESFGIGRPPEVPGLLGPLVLGAPGVPVGVGLLPGLVIAALALARRPEAPAAAAAA